MSINGGDTQYTRGERHQRMAYYDDSEFFVRNKGYAGSELVIKLEIYEHNNKTAR